ncbi:hypothetical protein CF336_g3625 [Tilletia laevis]|nr:hypothetical protein CF336_g3625 [Tilletia laevis]KAE8203799.1 hypothetical protein CF335_g2889 [Tilletia laevis]
MLKAAESTCAGDEGHDSRIPSEGLPDLGHRRQPSQDCAAAARQTHLSNIAPIARTKGGPIAGPWGSSQDGLLAL